MDGLLNHKLLVGIAPLTDYQNGGIVPVLITSDSGVMAEDFQRVPRHP